MCSSKPALHVERKCLLLRVLLLLLRENVFGSLPWPQPLPLYRKFVPVVDIVEVYAERPHATEAVGFATRELAD